VEETIVADGVANLNGGITVATDKFTVAAVTGNTVIKGTLQVDGGITGVAAGTVEGAIQYRSATGDFAADDAIVYTPASKRLRTTDGSNTVTVEPTVVCVSDGTNTGGFQLTGGTFCTGTLNALNLGIKTNNTTRMTVAGSNGQVAITTGIASTSSTTGALVITGGAGVTGDLYVGGTITSSGGGGGGGGWTNITPYGSVGVGANQVQNATAIPSTATAITIGLVQISTTATTIPYIRLGPTTTMDTSGYSSLVWLTSPTFAAPTLSTSQLNISNGTISAATVITCTYTLFKMGTVGGNDIWQYTMAGHTGTQSAQGSGTYQCSSGALRYVTLYAGAGNFDAGNWTIWAQ
jgi:hypothetical protein